MREDLLKKALEEAMDEDMSFIPKRQELEEMHEFSEKFDKQVRKMGAPKKILHFRYRKTWSVVAACLAVVILAGVYSQTYLPSSKSSDMASSESNTAEQAEGIMNYEDTTASMEESGADSSESAKESEVLDDSITNEMEQDSGEEENLQVNDSGRQKVEAAVVEELLQQHEKVICKNYQIEGNTCNIWLEPKESEIKFGAAEGVVYLCMENGEWYRYDIPYTVKTEENGDICIAMEELPNEPYTNVYVQVGDMVVVMEKK